MSYKPKCPICEKPVQKYENGYMDHILMDETSECKDEHHFYRYYYETGSWEETIGHATFHGHYADSDEERHNRGEVRKLVLDHEKANYKKAIGE